MLKKEVKETIDYLVKNLKEKQAEDGAWNFCFEGSPMTDAYMIILLRTLKIPDEVLIKSLANRLLSTQKENGVWKLYGDEEDGNLSSTVESYYALLYSGYKEVDAPMMIKAKQFIMSHGGIEQVSSLTKVMLMITGQYPWPKYFPFPIEFLLLPQSFMVNFFDFVGYARVHLAPILIVSDKKFKMSHQNTPDLSSLFIKRQLDDDVFREFRTNEAKSFLSHIVQSVKRLVGLPSELNQMAIENAKNYILKRIEPDGTLYSYFSTTFLMIFALLALGYSKTDPLIKNAIQGLKGLVCYPNEHPHIQESTSTVWDTSLISYALQNSGENIFSSAIQKANQYILQRQHVLYGDWSIQNPHTLPGGWGFSDINTMNPDVDDTTAALRAIKRMAIEVPTVRQSWYRGMDWVLSMQNNDGGWPAFERNTDQKILTMTPMDGSKSASIDPSTADLTGRTL